MIRKVKFVDFWPGFDPTENFLTKALDGVVDYQIGESPEIVFFSSFGREHEGFPGAIRVFYTGENIRANRFDCDYSINFDHLESRRHFRLPLYDIYPRESPVASSDRDKFCSIVVSNPKSLFRLKFFEKLHARKPVDSGGRVGNNVGGPVESKIEFISGYRFNIAFENSSYPGYTTEKLFEAKNAGCVPIYWGNPRVSDDFEPGGFIDVSSFRSWDHCIEHILEVDADPKLLQRYQNTPLFRPGTTPIEDRSARLGEFLRLIATEGRPRWKNRHLARWMAMANRMHTRRVDQRALDVWPETRGVPTGAGF